MYSILEVSKLTGISRDMIRHYEKLALVQPSRAANGYRQYSENDLYRLVMIRSLSNLGVNLKAVSKALRGEGAEQVLQQLSDEARRLETVRRTIVARQLATNLSLNAFQLYANPAQPYSTVHACKRFFYARDRHSAADYLDTCRRVSEVNSIFQHYYRQTFALGADGYALEATESGIILYDTELVSPNDVETLEATTLLQTVNVTSASELLSLRELLPTLETIRAMSGQSRFDVFSCQVFQLGQQDGRCVVSSEIPILAAPI